MKVQEKEQLFTRYCFREVASIVYVASERLEDLRQTMQKSIVVGPPISHL